MEPAAGLAALRRRLRQDPAYARHWKPMLTACAEGDAATVRLLLAHGADPEVASPSNWAYRPLHRAVEFRITMPRNKGHERIVEKLLDAGADPALRATAYRMTPLLMASITGVPAFIDSIRRRMGPLDLHAAAAVGDTARVRRLARNGGVNQVDEAGATPLWYCAASRLLNDHCRAANALLDAGANPDLTDGKAPPLCIALGHAANPVMAELLARRGASLETLPWMVDGGEFHMQHKAKGIAWMLARGAPVDAIDDGGRSALHRAALCGYTAIVRLLLQHGADPSRTDRDGRTPLDWARRFRHAGAARLLAGAGKS